MDIKQYKLPQEYDRYFEAHKKFCRSELEPLAVEIDRTGVLPEELWRKLRKSGLLALLLPKKYGGSEMTYSQYWPILEHVAKTHGSIRLLVHGSNTGCWRCIYDGGTEEQRQKYLPLHAQGKGFIGGALTEPDAGTGVDILTTAKKRGRNYHINGKKHLISYADFATIFFTVAYTNKDLRGEGITGFAVERDAPGLTIEPMAEMMCIRGSYHGVLKFQDCIVPEENVIGEPGKGLHLFLDFLDLSRVGIAVSCLGIAQRCLELSIDFAKQRVTFGKPLSERQFIQGYLAEMATDIYALREMIAQAGRKFDQKEPIPVEAAMCKLFAVEMVTRVTDKALLIYGGRGLTEAFAIERLYRDARALWFEEAAPSLQKLVIARGILGAAVRSV